MQSHYYTEYWALEGRHWWFRARRRILRSLLEEARLWGRGLLDLDVGSGPGRMLEFLREGFRVIGIDRDRDALRFAVRQTVRLLQADALVLPVRNGTVDVVSAFDLLEHLEDDLGALREFNRALRPGGHCIVTVPAFRLLWSEHDEVSHHRRRYRASELRLRFTAAGFEVIRCSYFNALLFVPIAGVRIAGRLLDWCMPGVTTRMRSDLTRFDTCALGPMFERVMGSEAGWLRRFNLPIGVSIVCIARKPTGAQHQRALRSSYLSPRDNNRVRRPAWMESRAGLFVW